MSDSSPDEQRDPASGIGISLDTGLDWSSPDSLTPEEAQTLIRWYADSHGEGDLQLTPFVDLLLAEMPGTMKRYRRMALAVAEGHDDAIPQAGVVLLFLGHYMSIGNERGVLYEIIAARDAGVTRRQVLGVIELTFLGYGPFAGNAAAASSASYLRAWDPAADDEAMATWPAGWRVLDPAEYRSGLDFSAGELTTADLADLRGWYGTLGLDTPRYVEVFSRHAPQFLKVVRDRIEHTVTTSRLPGQLIPLLDLFHAAAAPDLAGVANCSARARVMGCSRNQAIETVLWTSVLNGTEANLDRIAAAMDVVALTWG